jgi:hypothetical protein
LHADTHADAYAALSSDDVSTMYLLHSGRHPISIAIRYAPLSLADPARYRSERA